MKQSIEQIKQANDIVRIIGRYVRLEIRGDRATGLCPFHDDHHPSLQVNSRKQHYICYACGAKGDVIQFVKEIEKCTFAEVLKKLTVNSEELKVNRRSVQIRRICNPPDHKAEISKSSPLTKEQSQPLPPTIQIDHNPFLIQLMPCTAGHPELTPTWLEFEVGLAPWLITAKPWRPMAGRIIFPIRDAENRLVGFTGRLREGQDNSRKNSPKYINTPAGDGYQRNQHLYGFHKARPSIQKKKSIWLAEGPKDALALHAAGVTNAVALCGKDLSEAQTALFAGMVDQVRIFLDGDPAGTEAAATIQRQLRQKGIRANRISPVAGEDPDSLFRKLGKKQFFSWLRRNTDPLYPLEALLIVGTLLHPEATFRIHGEDHPCASLLSDILTDNYVPFQDPDCRAIAAWLKEEQKPFDVLTISQAIIDTLIEEHKDRWQEELNRTLEKEGLSNASGKLLRRLLLQYAEERLSEQTWRMLKKLADETDPQEREKLLQQTQIQKDLLAHVTKQLNKTSVIFTP